MTGRQVDPWGIGQGITDSVGNTGSVLGGLGRHLEGAGTLLVGLLLIAGSLVVLGAMLLNGTSAGQGLKRTLRTAGALVPK